jgi:hypothetical protein
MSFPTLALVKLTMLNFSLYFHCLVNQAWLKDAKDAEGP